MKILSSIDPRHQHHDIMPYRIKDGTQRWSLASINTGLVADMIDLVFDPRPEYIDVRAHGHNALLDTFREDFKSDPSAHTTNEWLFQLARHWAAWQSVRIGTFPLDYRDPSGPASRAASMATGDDFVYYVIDDILARMAGVDSETSDARWELPRHTGSEDAIQDAIQHCVAVLSRLDDWLELTGRGI